MRKSTRDIALGFIGCLVIFSLLLELEWFLPYSSSSDDGAQQMPWRYTFNTRKQIMRNRRIMLRNLKAHVAARPITKRKHQQSSNETSSSSSAAAVKKQQRRRNRDDDCHEPWYHKSGHNRGCMFRHITALQPYFVNMGFLVDKGSMSLGTETKTILDPRLFIHDNCQALSAGISTDSTFEQMLSKKCRNVHAFDCTVAANASHVANQQFAFHKVCIGRPTAIGDSTYMKLHHHHEQQTQDDDALVFEPLATIISKYLNHDASSSSTALNYFKFDIEGSEWDLLFNEILSLPSKLQPVQLMFELHTEGAHWRVVPPGTVEGKRQREVDKLFIRLLEAGYGILDIQVNNQDHYCAEVSVMKII